MNDELIIILCSLSITLSILVGVSKKEEISFLLCMMTGTIFSVIWSFVGAPFFGLMNFIVNVLSVAILFLMAKLTLRFTKKRKDQTLNWRDSIFSGLPFAASFLAIIWVGWDSFVGTGATSTAQDLGINTDINLFHITMIGLLAVMTLFLLIGFSEGREDP